MIQAIKLSEPPWIQGAKKIKNAKVPQIQQMLHRLFVGRLQEPGRSFLEWDRVKVRLLHTLELLPDAATILDAVSKLIVESGCAVPTLFKVVYASTAAFSTFLIPAIVRDLINVIIVALPKGMRKGPRVDYSVAITYLATIAAALISIGADSVRHICQLQGISYHKAEQLMGMIVPWMPYVLRISMIIQVMDLACASSFHRKLDAACWNHLYKGRVVIKTSAATRYQRALRALRVIKKHRHYARRANRGGRGLKYTVVKLEKQLTSWNPVTLFIAQGKAERLARGLRERSVQHMQNQVFGLGANLFALFALLAVNTVAIAVLSICSASYYWTQTGHRWARLSPLSFDQKPEAK